MKKIIISNNLMPVIKSDKNVLSRSGLTIFTALTGKDILEIHWKEKVDLIITEINMPSMDAKELCSIIRKEDSIKNVSIIVVHSANKYDVERCKSIRANYFITTPVNPEEFFQKIIEFLNIPERESMRVMLKVSVEGSHKNYFFFASSQDISISGILFETDKVISNGEKIKCSFFIRSHQVSTGGEIARVIKKDHDTYQYGVKFIDLDQTSKSKIEEFIKKHHRG